MLGRLLPEVWAANDGAHGAGCNDFMGLLRAAGRWCGVLLG